MTGVHFGLIKPWCVETHPTFDMEDWTVRFGYTLLYVEDVVKTVEFYESAFGLKRRFVHEMGYAEMETGETVLGFVAQSVVESNGVEYAKADPAKPAPAVEIAFVTEDVDGAYEKALTEGAVTVAPPKEKPWGQTVSYVRDLNGFLVELCTAVQSE